MYYIEKLPHTNPLLNQIIIRNDKLNFYSSIYPNLGASIQKLSSNETDIIHGISNNPQGLEAYRNSFNSSFLFPFPNRINEGKYIFNNERHQLECNETALNNSLHGHIYNKSFSITKQIESEDKAIISLGYQNSKIDTGFPFYYKLEITYTFTPNKMSIDFQINNCGKNKFPFGIGWHPYFNSKNLCESSLDFDAKDQYLLNDQMIPSSRISLKFETPLLIKDTFLDDCFITKESKASFNSKNYKIDLDFSSKTPHSFVQVYTPPTKDCIAIEPMTCAPDSFNNRDGLLILEPSEIYNWTVNLNYSIE